MRKFSFLTDKSKPPPRYLERKPTFKYDNFFMLMLPKMKVKSPETSLADVKVNKNGFSFSEEEVICAKSSIKICQSGDYVTVKKQFCNENNVLDCLFTLHNRQQFTDSRNYLLNE